MFRELGFTVEKIGETRPDPIELRDWTAAEVSLIVADYFDMLRLDPAGQEFVKAERNRALQERLNGRIRISIEFKHQNISAVLLDLELPYLNGYKPASNYQGRLLPEAVAAYLDAHPDIHGSGAGRRRSTAWAGGWGSCRRGTRSQAESDSRSASNGMWRHES
jgi:hypothetical protein